MPTTWLRGRHKKFTEFDRKLDRRWFERLKERERERRVARELYVPPITRTVTPPLSQNNPVRMQFGPIDYRRRGRSLRGPMGTAATLTIPRVSSVPHKGTFGVRRRKPYARLSKDILDGLTAALFPLARTQLKLGMSSTIGPESESWGNEDVKRITATGNRRNHVHMCLGDSADMLRAITFINAQTPLGNSSAAGNVNLAQYFFPSTAGAANGAMTGTVDANLLMRRYHIAECNVIWSVVNPMNTSLNGEYLELYCHTAFESPKTSYDVFDEWLAADLQLFNTRQVNVGGSIHLDSYQLAFKWDMLMNLRGGNIRRYYGIRRRTKFSLAAAQTQAFVTNIASGVYSRDQLTPPNDIAMTATSGEITADVVKTHRKGHVIVIFSIAGGEMCFDSGTTTAVGACPAALLLTGVYNLSARLLPPRRLAPQRTFPALDEISLEYARVFNDTNDTFMAPVEQTA